MCSCLDSVTKTSAYGVDLASSPFALGNRQSGPPMRRNVPENAECVQHPVGPERAYGFTEYLLFGSLDVFADRKCLIFQGAEHERALCDSGRCGFESRRPPHKIADCWVSGRSLS